MQYDRCRIVRPTVCVSQHLNNVYRGWESRRERRLEHCHAQRSSRRRDARSTMAAQGMPLKPRWPASVGCDRSVTHRLTSFVSADFVDRTRSRHRRRARADSLGTRAGDEQESDTFCLSLASRPVPPSREYASIRRGSVAAQRDRFRGATVRKWTVMPPSASENHFITVTCLASPRWHEPCSALRHGYSS